MAATSTSTDWVSYCRANRGDGGTIEALYALDDDELADIARKNHKNDNIALWTTMASSGGTNFVLCQGLRALLSFCITGSQPPLI